MVLARSAYMAPRIVEHAAFIGVDYHEFQPETFRGYFVYFGGAKRCLCQTMEEAVAQARLICANVKYLSSVDNYASDLKHEA